ncbi:hypothetical protein EG878_14610 [Enterococcus faecalis]|nr:hypothetical protein EG878_14610 [Enterococcus faecalis]
MSSNKELIHEDLMAGLDPEVVKNIEREMVGHWLEIALEVLDRDYPSDGSEITMAYVQELHEALQQRDIRIEVVPVASPELVYQFRIIRIPRVVSFAHHVEDPMEPQGGVH